MFSPATIGTEWVVHSGWALFTSGRYLPGWVDIMVLILCLSCFTEVSHSGTYS